MKALELQLHQVQRVLLGLASWSGVWVYQVTETWLLQINTTAWCCCTRANDRVQLCGTNMLWGISNLAIIFWPHPSYFTACVSVLEMVFSLLMSIQRGLFFITEVLPSPLCIACPALPGAVLQQALRYAALHRRTDVPIAGPALLPPWLPAKLAQPSSQPTLPGLAWLQCQSQTTEDGSQWNRDKCPLITITLSILARRKGRWTKTLCWRQTWEVQVEGSVSAKAKGMHAAGG